MECSKCGGLVVVSYGEAHCVFCGKYYFPPEPTGEICSQGGTCTKLAWRDGLCQEDWHARMALINKGRAKAFRYRR